MSKLIFSMLTFTMFLTERR